jgi:hypothetical protein
MSKTDEYFVYLYRDKKGSPVYFGQGKDILRATSHKNKSHNEEFDKWLKSASGKTAKLELIGPLGSKAVADAIESALISACKPAQSLRIFNKHPGNGIHKFRPFGVPFRYAERTMQILEKKELIAVSKKYGSTMFVRINQEDFSTQKGQLSGYDLASPPSDLDIKTRIEKWWQVNARSVFWSSNPSQSPGLLLGVTGSPGSQFIIGSARIDTTQWGQAEIWKGGLLKIPLLKTDSRLDAEALRGRPISREIGLTFNSFRHSQFRIFSNEDFEHLTKN